MNGIDHSHVHNVIQNEKITQVRFSEYLQTNETGKDDLNRYYGSSAEGSETGL